MSLSLQGLTPNQRMVSPDAPNLRAGSRRGGGSGLSHWEHIKRPRCHVLLVGYVDKFHKLRCPIMKLFCDHFVDLNPTYRLYGEVFGPVLAFLSPVPTLILPSTICCAARLLQSENKKSQRLLASLQRPGCNVSALVMMECMPPRPA